MISCENPRDALGVTARCRNVRFPPSFSRWRCIVHCRWRTTKETAPRGCGATPINPTGVLDRSCTFRTNLPGKVPRSSRDAGSWDGAVFWDILEVEIVGFHSRGHRLTRTSTSAPIPQFWANTQARRLLSTGRSNEKSLAVVAPQGTYNPGKPVAKAPARALCGHQTEACRVS